jgi:hypothetical protein
MAIVYNWNVSQTNYETANGFITTAHWQCNAVDGKYSTSTYSTCSWENGTPTIPYADVTMQEVLDWIWASGVEKTEIESRLSLNIADLVNPPIITPPLPWSQA